MSQTRNPQEQGAKPPFPEQQQTPPGSTSAMRPIPDHGEESYHGHNRLTGKVALITGGDSGIGRAVALAFAREGADVAISYLSEDEDAAETARLVRDAGRQALTIAGDIGGEAHCQALVRRTMQEFGYLDILVNNAAFQMSHEGLADLPSEEIERTFRTNVLAIFYLSKATLPQLRQRGRDHQHRLDRGVQARPHPPRLRRHQRGDRRLHQGAGAGSDQAGDPRQRRRPRPGLDAADPRDHAPRADGEIRPGWPDGVPRPTGGTRAHLRLPGLGRFALHHRRDHRCNRWATAPVAAQWERAGGYCPSAPRRPVVARRGASSGRFSGIVLPAINPAR